MPPESVQWFRDKGMRKSRSCNMARESFFTRHVVGYALVRRKRGEWTRDGAMADERAGFDNLDAPPRLTAWIALKPRMAVNTVVLAAVLTSWIALAALAVGTARLSLPP